MRVGWTSMMLTPVVVSPRAIANCMGDEPRYAGSKLGWMLITP